VLDLSGCWFQRFNPGDKLQQMSGVKSCFHGVPVGSGDARERMVVLPDYIPFFIAPG
jgi:hypothetical protein